MCLRFHQAFTDSLILEQLTKKDANFDVWNETGIYHACIAYIGFNGKECADAAKIRLNKYIEWAETHLPEKKERSFGRPSAQYVREQIAKFTPMKEHIAANNLNKEQILEYFDSLDDQ